MHSKDAFIETAAVTVFGLLAQSKEKNDCSCCISSECVCVCVRVAPCPELWGTSSRVRLRIGGIIGLQCQRDPVKLHLNVNKAAKTCGEKKRVSHKRLHFKVIEVLLP
eukprot:6456023-Amphidinium_carterae.2